MTRHARRHQRAQSARGDGECARPICRGLRSWRTGCPGCARGGRRARGSGREARTMPVPSPPTPDARLPKSRAPLTPPMAICGATAAVCRDARWGSVRRAEVRLRAPRAQGGLSALQARLRALDARHGQAGRRHESLDAAERNQKDSDLSAQRGAHVSRPQAGLARGGGLAALSAHLHENRGDSSIMAKDLAGFTRSTE